MKDHSSVVPTHEGLSLVGTARRLQPIMAPHAPTTSSAAGRHIPVRPTPRKGARAVDLFDLSTEDCDSVPSVSLRCGNTDGLLAPRRPPRPRGEQLPLSQVGSLLQPSAESQAPGSWRIIQPLGFLNPVLRRHVGPPQPRNATDCSESGRRSYQRGKRGVCHGASSLFFESDDCLDEFPSRRGEAIPVVLDSMRWLDAPQE